jgi:histidinol-phosphatase (PHP family)
MCDLQYFKQFKFDYIIGAVHYFPYQFADGYFFNFDTREDLFVKGLTEFFAGDIKRMVSTYFEHINKMLLSSKPDIVAHLDIIGKFNLINKFYNPSQKWHNNLVEETLNIIKQKECVLEVNARRKYKNIHHDNSPETEILKSALKKNIPITISGDVHYSSDFPLYWQQTLEHVKQLGFREIMYINHEGWHSLTI